MSNIITKSYECMQVDFTGEAWFNATSVAARFGKRVDVWLKTQETQEYIAALARALNSTKRCELIRTSRGRLGGTWLHPKLGVMFARWLDVNFAIWCDMQIDEIGRASCRGRVCQYV